MDQCQGLSESEVASRRAAGLGNQAELRSSRTYVEILRRNAFTFINTVLFAIGIILIVLGNYGDALVTAGLVLLNVVVGVVQEARAKQKLDHIALVTRPKATVIREGRHQAIDPQEIVQDDLLIVRPGDQVVVDGEMVTGDAVAVDESLLTGESDPVAKAPGDPVYSGSFCVAGSAVYRATAVGEQSLAHKLTAQARSFRQVKTPLQQDVDFVIRLLVLLVAQLGILLGISLVIKGLPVVDSVRAAAVIVALVPQGLFFMTTVAYAMGALRVAERGALIQESNAVESTSNVNLLCLDKTGTLTTNRICLQHTLPLPAAETDESGLHALLGDYVASTPDPNRTALAIGQAYPGEPQDLCERVPFSSDYKWSGLAFADQGRGVFILGAPEILAPHVAADNNLDPQVAAWSDQGLRVLLFARHPGGCSLYDGDGRPRLPDDLRPLALLGFCDELRPEAEETIRHFANLGIGLKIISGDHPETVLALARQAGLGEEITAISGLELEGLDDRRLAQIAEQTTVFGRIRPQQKEKLVQVLRRRGYYVAMIGDGVNDVLSLKQAHVGVAMESGSQATRSVADIVLLGDTFAVLPVAFREGQRIIKGMEDVVRLLLTRTVYVTLLILAAGFVGVEFPVTPKHNSLIALLTVGIPILAIAAWARPGPPPKSVLKATVRFVFPAAFTISVVVLIVYLAALGMTGDVDLAHSALTTISILCGILLIPFVESPTPWWVGGDELSGDWRPTMLAVGMLLAYVLVLALPPLRNFFELVLLPPAAYLALVAIALAWAVLVRQAWRTHFFTRLLNIEID